MPPDIFCNEYALWCNLVHFETQFWRMLQWHFFFSRDYVPFHILVVSLDREYLLHVRWPHGVWMIFHYSYLYTVMIIYLGEGDVGHFSFFCGGWGGSFYPSNTQDSSLQYIRQLHRREPLRSLRIGITLHCLCDLLLLMHDFIHGIKV